MISTKTVKLAMEVVDEALAQLGRAEMLSDSYDYTIDLATAGKELTAELAERNE